MVVRPESKCRGCPGRRHGHAPRPKRGWGGQLKQVPITTGHIGTAAIPNIDDLVLLTFDKGDVNQPIVIGRLYNDEDRPPLNNPDEVMVWLQGLPYYDKIAPYQDDILTRAGQMVGVLSKFLINNLSNATTGTVHFLFMMMIMTPAITAAIDPTDRSIPPAVITNVAPTAIIPMNADRVSKLVILPSLKKAVFSE